MIDRFGPLPRQAETLLLETEIRILAGAWKVDRIHVEGGQYIVMTYSDSMRIEALARRHQGMVRIVDARKAYVPLGDDPVKTPEIAERLLALLRT
jgi:transcription-repair coupling factor (superfamily II helicase)